MKTLCLNMIVKNEAAIIERCLASVAPHIGCYCIADTGSTDDTMGIIRRFFDARGIPGEIPQTVFRDFEQARNFALEQARDAVRRGRLRFDYLLLSDADMDLRVDDPSFRARLMDPVYMMLQRTASGLEYGNVRLVRADCQGQYVGVTHEVFDTDQPRPLLEGAWFFDHACGGNRVTKFQRDADLLTAALAKQPDHSRYRFYLANTYYDMEQHEAAIAEYERRLALDGWAEELFYSRYRIAQSLLRLGREAEFVLTCLRCFEQHPHRAEPLYLLAKHFTDRREHRLGYHFASLGVHLAAPPGGLFVEAPVYRWQLLDQMAVCAYYIGRVDECLAMNRRLLGLVPDSERPRIEQNMTFCRPAPGP